MKFDEYYIDATDARWFKVVYKGGYVVYMLLFCPSTLCFKKKIILEFCISRDFSTDKVTSLLPVKELLTYGRLNRSLGGEGSLSAYAYCEIN